MVPARRRPRARLGRSGRLPYSFVGIVILAAMVILTAYFQLAVNWSNQQGSYNVPEDITDALAIAEQDIASAAQLDLMRSEAALLQAGPNPALNTLNGSVNGLFDGSLASLGLSTPGGFEVDSVTIYATSWGVNVTWDQGQVQTTLPQLSLRSGLSDPNLPLAEVPDASRTVAPGQTEAPVYPVAIGEVNLFADYYPTNTTSSQTYSFAESIASDLGLLQDSAAQFSASTYGPDGQFSQLVQYLTTTVGELRALSGYATGGYPGPQAGTDVNSTCGPTGTAAVLSCNDVRDAVSLATLLASLQYFRSYDPNATYAFLSSLPPGAYQTLLTRYVDDGVVDGGALFLLLLNNTGGWSDGWVSSGEALAQAAEGFSDRLKFDLLQQFLGTEVVDPTLIEPVVNWQLIYDQYANGGRTFYINGLYDWLNQYQKWLGITLSAIPSSSFTADIPGEACNAAGACGAPGTIGGCVYTIFPGGQIQVANNGIPNLAELIMGTNNGPDTQSTPAEDLPPTLFNVFENVSIFGLNGNVIWSEANSPTPEQAGYYVVDHSLLDEYEPSEATAWAGTLQPYRFTYDALVNDTSDVIGYKPLDPTNVVNTGFTNYLADQALHDGNNYTLTQAGLPDFTTNTGVNQALTSPTYSLLTNGSNAIISGPLSLAVQKYSTQASNLTWVEDAWVNGADHTNLLNGDPPYPESYNTASATTELSSVSDDYNMSDIARVTVRDWFQALYMLWYGSAGVIPAAPVGTISYNTMDAANYRVSSPGVQTNPPYPYHEPDFAINVMNETYISVMDWMGWDLPSGTECNGGFGTCSYTGAHYVGAYDSCPAGAPTAEYDNAVAEYYSDEGKAGTGMPDRTWLDVRGAVWHALNGTATTTGPGANPGIDWIHTILGQSWWNVKNNTGDGSWASQNFTTWINDTIAPPILNDTVAMGQTGGWLSQIFASTRSAIWQGANQTGVIDKPFLENGQPYQFWQGNYTDAAADQYLFNESLNISAGRTITGDGLSLVATPPAETIHLVDAQDDASNMGIAPYSSTWTVSLDGHIWLNLTSNRPVLLGASGGLQPTNVNMSVPIDTSVPVTIYTPWPIGSGWDRSETPLPGDPGVEMTRGVFGLEGHDYHAAPDFFPGTYISPSLDDLLQRSSSLGRVLQAEGLDQANLLAALPDRGVGASAPLAQNLTRLENDTATALAATPGAYETAQQADLTTLYGLLNAVPGAPAGAFLDVAFSAPAYYGFAGELNLRTSTLTYFGNPLPSFGARATFGDPLEYSLDFAGAQTAVTYFIDNDFALPGPPLQGIEGSWTVTGDYSLTAYYQDFATHYTLVLTGGPAQSPVAPSTNSYAIPSLSVPYIGPAVAYPATISVSSVSAIGTTLPAAAGGAFTQAIASYYPPGGDFAEYALEQEFQAGYLYDDVGATAPLSPGITEFGYATSIGLASGAGAARQYNLSYQIQDRNVAGGLFNAAPSQLDAFLLWYVANHETLSYSLGELSADPTVLASAEPYLLTTAYRNVTLSTGAWGAPSTFAYLSANLAFSEGDLGGTGGGLANSPTLLLGGGTPGTFEIAGALTEA